MSKSWKRDPDDHEPRARARRDRNLKSWARLRALVSKLSVAGVALAAPAAAAAAPAEAPVLASGRSLALELAELPALASMGVAAELALSGAPDERLALAEALGWSFPLVGDGVVIEHLAGDPEPAVRAAAARAAWIRRTNQLDLTVLHRLLGDDDPEVRAAAWLAVSR